MDAQPRTADDRPRHFGKAILAGLIAGAVGTAVKTINEAIVPPRPPGAESPLGAGVRIIATHFTGHDLDPSSKMLAERTVHWAFGIGTGVVYALIAEKWRKATLGYGVAFGVIFWLLAHEIVLPLMGWSPTPRQMTLWEQGNELISHCTYGVAVELARRVARRAS